MRRSGKCGCRDKDTLVCSIGFHAPDERLNLRASDRICRPAFCLDYDNIEPEFIFLYDTVDPTVTGFSDCLSCVFDRPSNRLLLMRYQVDVFGSN